MELAPIGASQIRSAINKRIRPMPDQQKKYILAIDLGTSGPKVAIVSTQWEVLASDFEPTDLDLFGNGAAEQDPEQWWDAIIAASKRLIALDLVPKNNIIAISCTAQWSGTVAVDQAGNHLAKAIIWMDSRGFTSIKKVTKGPVKIEGYAINKLIKWIRLTGGAPGHSGKDSIAHILYMKDEMPELYSKAHMFLEPKDYINMRLTGKFVSTQDTMTLHWVTDNRDINNIKYHKGLLKLSQLDPEKLPPIIKTTDIIGPIKKDIALKLGLNENVKVVGGTPDVQSAAIGSGAIRDFEANLCIGTSSFLTCHVPFKKTDLFHNMASLPSGIPGKYFIANEQETSGVCLDFLKDNLFFYKDELDTNPEDKDVFELFSKIAESSPPGSGKLIFTPWLYGERTPVDDHTIRGGFYNLSLQTTRADMIRAVYEGVAFNSKWLLKYVEKFAGKKFESINLIGGGGKSSLWCQILADVLNRQINQVNEPRHANARGAAALAIVAMGYATFEDLADKIIIDKEYIPNPDNREIYDKMFEEYLNIYKNNHKMYSRLNKK